MLLLLALCTIAETIAEPPALTVLGVDAKGRVAYLWSGTHDGSGFPFAEARLIDPKTKAVAKKVSVTLDKEGATVEAAIAEARAKLAAPTLSPLEEKALTINPGHEDTPEMTGRDGAPLGNALLSARKTKGACDAPFKPLLLTLKLALIGGDADIVVQAEKQVPKERACATQCRLKKVVAANKTFAAFVACDVPGFEGKAQSWTALSGTLELPLDPTF